MCTGLQLQDHNIYKRLKRTFCIIRLKSAFFLTSHVFWPCFRMLASNSVPNFKKRRLKIHQFAICNSKRGSTLRSSLKGQERAVINRINTGTVLMQHWQTAWSTYGLFWAHRYIYISFNSTQLNKDKTDIGLNHLDCYPNYPVWYYKDRCICFHAHWIMTDGNQVTTGSWCDMDDRQKLLSSSLSL